jgi:hypothetical protein
MRNILMTLFSAKQTGTTEKGSWYSILQDGPASFHITVGKDNNVVYEHFENPPNIDHLMNNIILLENELEQMTP